MTLRKEKTSLGTLGKMVGWIQIQTTLHLWGRDFIPECSGVLSVFGGKLLRGKKPVSWGIKKFAWNLRRDSWELQAGLLVILGLSLRVNLYNLWSV